VQIPDTAAKFNITNNLRLAHFLAQCGHESGGFKAVSENLNYSADGLTKTFGKYFPANALALAYARKPEQIANRVYGNRLGNGDEKSGDGYRFRGRGAIQLTGKANYQAFADYLKRPEIMDNPDLVAEELSFESALYFFNKNNLWRIADKGVSDIIITELTRRINGGINGLSDRIKLTNKYNSYL
jgi:putative chitinase